MKIHFHSNTRSFTELFQFKFTKFIYDLLIKQNIFYTQNDFMGVAKNFQNTPLPELVGSRHKKNNWFLLIECLNFYDTLKVIQHTRVNCGTLSSCAISSTARFRPRTCWVPGWWWSCRTAWWSFWSGRSARALATSEPAICKKMSIF